MAGEIVHIELKSGDFARSAAFYEKLFGWRSDGAQAGGHLMFETPGGEGGGGGGSVQGSWIRTALAQAPGAVPFIAVDDLDAVLAGAEQQGGRVLVRRMSLGTRGVFGLIADPDGNVVGLLVNRPGVAGAKSASASEAPSVTASPGKAAAAAKPAKAAAKKPAAAKRPAKRGG
jgi:predicted enzyme related to lactoylglutathione lyase